MGVVSLFILFYFYFRFTFWFLFFTHTHKSIYYKYYKIKVFSCRDFNFKNFCCVINVASTNDLKVVVLVLYFKNIGQSKKIGPSSKRFKLKFCSQNRVNKLKADLLT